ncbi:hypothetical protein LXA43DRAFT_432665 [Ganoderma leucocontextum]|nr:hypothetical protein LXA43DRAFT_432665 [Ganoderma leucocontextum]
MPPVKTSDKSSPESDTPKQRKRPGRVPVSCAECRRLKLRCDRKVPCETCTKRGCAALCPEGTFSGCYVGVVGAMTISSAGCRVVDYWGQRNKTRSNALETALRTLQATVSDIPHPLLEENTGPPRAYLSASPPIDTPGSSGTSQQTSTADEEDVLDAFETRFFGQTSAPWTQTTGYQSRMSMCNLRRATGLIHGWFWSNPRRATDSHT